MCIIKFSTQQRKGIHDMTNNLKIIISVRRGELTFFCSVYIISVLSFWHVTPHMICTDNVVKNFKFTFSDSNSL